MTSYQDSAGRARRPASPLRGGGAAGNAQVGSYTDPSRPSHPSGARDYTTSPVGLEPLTAKLRFNVGLVNRAGGDPYRALECAVDLFKSALDRADHRNRPAADGWRWAAVNILLALAVAVERKDLPDPWFRDRRNWRLNPDGWAPLRPVVATFRRLSREEEGPR